MSKFDSEDFCAKLEQQIFSSQEWLGSDLVYKKVYGGFSLFGDKSFWMLEFSSEKKKMTSHVQLFC